MSARIRDLGRMMRHHRDTLGGSSGHGRDTTPVQREDPAADRVRRPGPSVGEAVPS